MEQIDWYVDFLSPFAYLHALQLRALPAGFVLRPRPVLFAALLRHWGHKGPADIPPKRGFTFTHVQWQAQQLGVPFRFPEVHPFNPLRPLRLAIALGERLSVVEEILRFIWAEGHVTDDPQCWDELSSRLGATDAESLINQPQVKERLRANGEAAIAAGVFGVPTAVARGKLFWGADSTAMMLAYLRDPGVLETPEMRRVTNLPMHRHA